MKYLKKWNALLLAGILVAVMLLSNAVLAQDENAEFTVIDVKGYTGGQVEVLIGINNITKELTGIDMEVYFDNSKLEVVSVEDATLFSDYNGSQMESDHIILGWGSGLSKIPNDTSGTIAKITFKIAEDCLEGAIEIKATLRSAYDFDVNEIEVSEAIGTVTVELPAHDHIWGDWIETKAATCTEEGSREHQCTVNGCKEKETQVIPMTGHAYDGMQEELSKADCTNDGSVRTYCSNAGCISYIDTVVDKLGHMAGDWEESKAATCTETGLKEKHCTVCDITVETKTTDTLGHSFGEWTIEKEAGIYIEGLKTRLCAVCQFEEEQTIPAIVHDEEDHTFDGKEETVKTATCTEQGTLRKYCSFEGCNAYSDTTIPATGHKEGEWTEKKSATCTETGLKEKNCTVCNEKLGEQTIEALGHSYDAGTVVKEASCTEEGILRKYCSFEGCDVHSDTTIPATGHKEGEWTEKKSATCTETGLKEKYCTVCKEKVTEEVIAALGHSYDEATVVTEATCTAEGLLRKSCSFEECEEYIEETIPVKAHAFGEWIVLEKAEIGKAGLKERYCTVCEEKEQQEIIALDESNDNADGGSKEENSPQTGDTMQLNRYIIFLVSALAISNGIAIYKKKTH